MTKFTAAFLSLLAIASAQFEGKLFLCTTLDRCILISSVRVRAASNTASDVENGVCAPVTLIFARGTTETGNLGTVVGPPLAAAMKSAFGDNNVAVQGVNYAANIAGATTGATDPKNAAGALNMAMLANTALTNCPKTKVVLSGYSQGAEEVRGALMNMANNKAAVSFSLLTRSHLQEYLY
jgi:cutinase